jgi:hypothetical protein
MEAVLLRRIEAAITQLRLRAEDLYQDDKWPDGDFMNEIAALLEDITLPSRLPRTRDA